MANTLQVCRSRFCTGSLNDCLTTVSNRDLIRLRDCPPSPHMQSLARKHTVSTGFGGSASVTFSTLGSRIVRFKWAQHFRMSPFR
eukprot:9372867-Pyramimonas_sp.AAC.1